MKLLLCLDCDAIFNLDYHLKVCPCGVTQGKYIDKQNAIYSGESAIPLAIGNQSIGQAIRGQKEEGEGVKFDSVVVAKNCPTFIKKKGSELHNGL